MYKKKKLYILRELFAIILLFYKLLVPKQKFRILSIYFHDPNPILFEKVIKYLIAKDYRAISLLELNDIIDRKNVNEKIVFITLDDGWKNNLSLIEIARKYNFPIAIFITTSAVEEGNFWFEYVERKQERFRLFKLNENEFKLEITKLKSSLNLLRSTITEDELIILSKEPLVTIGSHTVSHISLPNNPLKIQENELINSKYYLEKTTNQAINYFSYPFGHKSEQLKTLLKECDYTLAFSTDTNHINLINIDKLSIPRRCINDDAGYYEALSKIFGFWYKFRM